MERPEHAIAGFCAPASTPTRIVSIAFVGALHVVLIYALVTGLAARLVTQIPHELTAQVVKPEQPKEEPPPPVEASLVKPALPSVEVPLIRIQLPRIPQHAITAIIAPPTRPAVVPPVTVAPPALPAPTPASAVVRTHTIPPYPDQSRRLGEHGTVQLRIEVATDGSVSDAAVVQTSGSSTLDKAAVAWVKDHWRYKPATQDGHAVSTSVEAAVVFNLKNAG